MGAFSSAPVTEKLSNDEGNDKLKCGSSSMQGWRSSQEDAHNCLLDFDINTSFFAVYDGHGGHEVAQYCAQKLSQFIKELQTYKDGDIEKALVEGFLGFDATIASKEVIDILKEIAGDRKADDESDEENGGKKKNDDDSDEENVDNLYEEAAMPIEQVIEKYANLVNPALKDLKKTDPDKVPKSPFLKAKREGESSVATSSASSSSEAGDSKHVNSLEGCSNFDGVSSSCNYGNEAKILSVVKDDIERNREANGSLLETKVTSSDSAESKEALIASSNNEVETVNAGTAPVSSHNGEVSEAQPKVDVTSSSPTQENGEIASKGKGKALAKNKGLKVPLSIRPKRNAKQLYKTLLDFAQDSDDDTEDEEDKTFEGPNDASSDDDDDEGVNIAVEAEGSDDSSGEEEEAEEEEEEIDEEGDLDFARNMKEEPGFDSGCTAVVGILKGNELYVANAGDSRCIVCRNGKAVDMSFDHKPEDEPERERIVKAGGRVIDGRVNEGLNLSRAIGDFAYKQNKELSDREQMITALPDIKTLTINPAEDEFMVLACDGIWNVMSSQEVVDFVRARIATCEKLSQICEEMFEHCLAPNTLGDGTGCDNMTAIIVQFKPNILKRAASPEPAESDSKRAKTEDNESQIDTTA